jgi:hypothetical protein
MRLAFYDIVDDEFEVFLLVDGFIFGVAFLPGDDLDDGKNVFLHLVKCYI